MAQPHNPVVVSHLACLFFLVSSVLLCLELLDHNPDDLYLKTFEIYIIQCCGIAMWGLSPPYHPKTEKNRYFCSLASKVLSINHTPYRNFDYTTGPTYNLLSVTA